MQGFVGWDMKVASTNLWSDYRVDAEGNTPSFFKVLQKNLLLQLLHLPILLLILLLLESDQSPIQLKSHRP